MAKDLNEGLYEQQKRFEKHCKLNDDEIKDLLVDTETESIDDNGKMMLVTSDDNKISPTLSTPITNKEDGIRIVSRRYMSRAGWSKVLEVLEGVYGPKEVRPMLECIMSYAYGKPKPREDELKDNTLQVMLSVQSNAAFQLNVDNKKE